jgi:hypothetical protein
MGLFKFLKSLRTLANNRNITIDEAYKFAKQEFGEVSDLLKLQINKIFKDVEAPSIKLPKKPEGKVIEASFKPGVGKRVEESPSQAEGTIMDRLSGAANRLQELMKEREAMYKPKQGLQVSEGLTRTLARKILDRKRIQVPKGQDPIDVFSDIFGESIYDVKNLADEMVEIDQAGGGMKNMDEMLEAEGLYDIEIPENPQRGLSKEELKQKDPNLYDLLYGEEPEDFATGGRVGYGKGGAVKKGIKALVDEINKKFGKGTIKLGKDVKRPESSEMREAFLEFKKRQGFAYGSGKKLVQVLKTLGTDLKKEIKKAVDDLIPSGDPKLDADMAVDNMLEDLNIDRDAIDQYDVLDAYGLAYDEIKKPLLQGLKNKPKPSPKKTEQEEMEEFYKLNEQPSKEFTIKDMRPMKLLKPISESQVDAIIQNIKKLDPLDAMKEVNKVVKRDGFYKDLSDKQSQKIFDDTQDHIFERDIKPKETDMDFDEAADEMASLGAPKAAERAKLKQKYPGIDDKLLTQIIDDPDPQRKAEVLATIDQAFELMKQGKSPNEVLDIMKQMTDRTKQAGGGLAYLMGL